MSVLSISLIFLSLFFLVAFCCLFSIFCLCLGLFIHFVCSFFGDDDWSWSITALIVSCLGLVFVHIGSSLGLVCNRLLIGTFFVGRIVSFPCLVWGPHLVVWLEFLLGICLSRALSILVSCGLRCVPVFQGLSCWLILNILWWMWNDGWVLIIGWVKHYVGFLSTLAQWHGLIGRCGVLPMLSSFWWYVSG